MVGVALAGQGAVLAVQPALARPVARPLLAGLPRPPQLAGAGAGLGVARAAVSTGALLRALLTEGSERAQFLALRAGLGGIVPKLATDL